MSKRMSMAAMAVAVLVFYRSVRIQRNPHAHTRIPGGHPYALNGDSYGERALTQFRQLSCGIRTVGSVPASRTTTTRCVVLLLPPGVSCRRGSYSTWRGCHER